MRLHPILLVGLVLAGCDTFRHAGTSVGMNLPEKTVPVVTDWTQINIEPSKSDALRSTLPAALRMESKPVPAAENGFELWPKLADPLAGHDLYPMYHDIALGNAKAAREGLRITAPFARDFDQIVLAADRPFFQIPLPKPYVSSPKVDRVRKWITATDVLMRAECIVGSPSRATALLVAEEKIGRKLLRANNAPRTARTIASTVNTGAFILAESPKSTPAELRNVLANYYKPGDIAKNACDVLLSELNYTYPEMLLQQEAAAKIDKAKIKRSEAWGFAALSVFHERPVNPEASLKLMASAMPAMLANLKMPFAKRDPDIVKSLSSLWAPVVETDQDERLPDERVSALLHTENPEGKVFTLMVFRGEEGTEQSAARMETKAALARLFLALEAFWKQHDKMPAKLTDVPEIAEHPKWFLQPATGAEFNYSAKQRLIWPTDVLDLKFGKYDQLVVK